jgi:hypothetical protein
MQGGARVANGTAATAAAAADESVKPLPPRAAVSTTAAPERQSARAPERQSARAPERQQSARAPERRQLDAIERELPKAESCWLSASARGAGRGPRRPGSPAGKWAAYLCFGSRHEGRLSAAVLIAEAERRPGPSSGRASAEAPSTKARLREKGRVRRARHLDAHGRCGGSLTQLRGLEYLRPSPVMGLAASRRALIAALAIWGAVQGEWSQRVRHVVLRVLFADAARRQASAAGAGRAERAPCSVARAV